MSPTKPTMNMNRLFRYTYWDIEWTFKIITFSVKEKLMLLNEQFNQYVIYFEIWFHYNNIWSVVVSFFGLASHRNFCDLVSRRSWKILIWSNDVLKLPMSFFSKKCRFGELSFWSGVAQSKNPLIIRNTLKSL